VSTSPLPVAAPAAGELEARLFPRGAPALDISRLALPAPLRPAASLTVLDISEYFAECSGGVRTYLMQKARYVEARPELRQVLVVPGVHDTVGECDGVRAYRLHGPLIPMQKTYRFLLATRSIGRIVAHERPDVVEVGSAYFAPWLVHRATARLDVPAVWFYHSNIPRVFAPRGERDRPLRRLAASAGWAYVRRIAATVHTTIVASEFVARDLERAGITRIAHVPLGVDTALFHPARRAARDETRRRRGLGDGRRALYGGRFSPEKDLFTLIRGWPAVHRRTGAELAIVGDGGIRAKVARAAPRAAGVRLLPFETDRPALADLYAAADLLVSSGPTETFGLAALEAMASGTPVLSCYEGGVAETVRRSGAGALYAAGDPAALADAAVALLGGDLAALGTRGRAHAERHHTWERVFDRIVEVYRGVIAG
jgi:alpha-1,6-mannosyltransferase